MEEYNKYLVDSNISITIIDYVKEANKRKYNIDLTFMEEFLELVERDDFCISHSMLVKYEIINTNSGTIDIKRMLEQYGFKENIDYLLRNVAEQTCRGERIKNEYVLKPDTFKKCVIKSKNKPEYADYYILLERCIVYYNKYQIALKNKYLSIKDDRIDQQSAKIDELLGHTKDIKEDLGDLTDMVFEYAENNETLKVEKAIASNERVNTPSNKNNIEQLVVLRLKNNIDGYKYRTIRGIVSYVRIEIRKYTGISFNKDWSIKHINPNYNDYNYEFVKIYNDIPNARHLLRAVKEREIGGITTHSVEFNISISEQEVLDIFQMAFDLRWTIEIEEKEQKAIKNRAKQTIIKSVKNKSKKI
jgi:phage anti-repressor protein